MKSFKKLLVLSFSVLLPFAMVSCGKNNKSEEPKSEQPSVQPSQQGSEQPSVQPSEQPSVQPSEQPSVEPSEQPSEQPSTPVVESIAEGLRDALLTEQSNTFRNPVTADFVLPVRKVYYDAEEEQQYADITWEVSVTAGGVENVVSLDGEPEDYVQKFKVIFEDTNDVETSFKVTGHIHVSDDDEATVEFNGVVPAFKWATLEEFLQAAKDSSTDVLTVKGRVTTTHASNGVFIVNEAGEGFYAFKPKNYNKSDWKQGDLVKVSGTATIYFGQPEFNQGCTVTKISDAEEGFEVPFKDVTEEFAKVSSSNAADILTPLMNAPIKVTGAKVTDITLNSTGNYFNFTLAGAEGAQIKYYYRGSTSYLGITQAIMDAPMSEWIEGYTATIQGVLSIYSGNYYIMPITSDGYEITDRTLNDEQAVNAALSLFSSTFRTDYRVPQEVLLDSEDAETGAKFAYTLEDGATALSLEAGKLIVSPLAAETTVKLTVTASRGEGENEKTASKEFDIVVGGTTYETISADEAAVECDKLASGVTSEGYYYIAGKVSKITNTKYSNFELETTNGKTLVIYGLYNPKDPTSAYGTDKPEGFVPVYEGEEVVIYGQLTKYNTTLEVVNGQLLTDPVKTLVVDGSSEGGYTIYADEATGCQLGDYTVAVDKNGKIIYASRNGDYGGPQDGFYHDGSFVAKAGELCGIFNLQADWAPWPAETFRHYSVVAPEQGYIITGSFTQMAGLVGQIAGQEYTDLSTDIVNNTLFENTLQDGALNKTMRIEVEGYVDPDAFRYTLDATKASNIYIPGEKFALNSWAQFVILDAKGRIVYSVAAAGAGYGAIGDGDAPMFNAAPMYTAQARTLVADGKVVVPANCMGYSFDYSDDEGTYGGFASTISEGAVSGSLFDSGAYDPKVGSWNSYSNAYITNKTILSVAYPESGEISIALAYAKGLGLENKVPTEATFTLKDARVYTSGKSVYVTDGKRSIQLYADKGDDNAYCTALLHDDYLVTVTGNLENYDGKIEIVGFKTLVEFTPAKYSVTLQDGYENVTLSSTDALENLDYGAKVKISAVAADGYTVTKVLANDAPVAEKDGLYEVTVAKNTKITAETVLTKELESQNLLATASFGTKGEEGHVDGTNLAKDDTTGVSATVDGVAYSLTKLSKVYGLIPGATGLNDSSSAKASKDAKGNEVLKLGTGTVAGKFTLTVPENINMVSFHVANYKSNTGYIKLNNGEAQVLVTSSDKGEYAEYTATPDANHQVAFETCKNSDGQGDYRCMLLKIDFYHVDPISKIAVTESVTSAGGLAVYTSADYRAHTEAGWQPSESWVWGTNVVVDANGRIAYLVVNANSGYGGPNGTGYYVDETVYPDYQSNPVFTLLDGFGPWVSGGTAHTKFEVKVPEGGFAIYTYGAQAGELIKAISGGEFTAANDDTKANINKRHDSWNGGKLVYDKDNGQVYYYKLEQSAAPAGFVVNQVPADGSYTFAWAAGGDASTKYLLVVRDAFGNVLSGFNRKEVTNGANFAANLFDYDVEYTASLFAREEGKADSLAATSKFTKVSPDANAVMDFETLTDDSQIAAMGWTQYCASQTGFDPTSGQMHVRDKNGSKVLNAYCDTNLRKYQFSTGEFLGLANKASIDLGNYWNGGAKGAIEVSISIVDIKGAETFILGTAQAGYSVAYDEAAGLVDLPAVIFAPIYAEKVNIYTKSTGNGYLYMDNLTLEYEQQGKGLAVYNADGDLAQLEYNRVRGVWTGSYAPAQWKRIGLRYTANDDSEVKMIRGGSASIGGNVTNPNNNIYEGAEANKLYCVDADEEAAGLWCNPTAGVTYTFTYNPVRNAFWVSAA